MILNFARNLILSSTHDKISNHKVRFLLVFFKSKMENFAQK